MYYARYRFVSPTVLIYAGLLIYSIAKNGEFPTYYIPLVVFGAAAILATVYTVLVVYKLVGTFKQEIAATERSYQGRNYELNLPSS